ncbi:MAG TPA: LysR substrate-binding domain-containing protein [Burkholderiaceae bacterium]|nr:LysR substrate-binding domain-containing protein [Burkholderiaceae bacterium]
MSSIRVLKTFIAVAAEGSFAAAANHVALTQAAVGLQMRSLEADLKRALFERQGKAVALNDTGRELLPIARKLVALYEQMLASPPSREAMSGTVHLGAVVSAVRPLIQATLALKSRYPALELHVTAAKSIELIARVESGELDAAIAVRESGQGRPSLAWTALYAEPLVLLAPRSLPDAPLRTLLQRHPFIRFDQSQHTGRLVERTLKKLRVKPQEFLELNAIETIVELVRSGLGLAILPHLRDSRWHSDPKLRVVGIAQAMESREVALVQARTSPKAELVGAVVREFQAKL